MAANAEDLRLEFDREMGRDGDVWKSVRPLAYNPNVFTTPVIFSTWDEMFFIVSYITSNRTHVI